MSTIPVVGRRGRAQPTSEWHNWGQTPWGAHSGTGRRVGHRGTAHQAQPRLAGRVKRRSTAGCKYQPPAPYQHIVELDHELHESVTGAAALRLQLGEAFEVLNRRGWQAELGYSSLGAYALQRCSQRGSWAEEAHRVAKRLTALPVLRTALQAGAVNWSMAELVSRHATEESDRELTREAQRRTVRGMREWLACRAQNGGQRPVEAKAPGGVPERCASAGSRAAPPWSAGESSNDVVASCPSAGGPWVLELVGCSAPASVEERDPMCTLSLTVDREVAWMLEATQTIIELFNGNRSCDEFVECLVAEALTSLPDCPHTGLLPDADSADQEQARQRAWLEQCAVWRREGEKLCEQNIAALLGLGQKRLLPPEMAEPTARAAQGRGPKGCTTAQELDALIHGLALQFSQRDLRIGTLALRMSELHGWRRLGFASEAHYARERLGLSVSSLRAKRALARRLRTLPAVRAALELGVIGLDAAQQIARVATGHTEALWVERAKQRTAKHLREEVELAEVVARRTGERGCAPPNEEQMQAYFGIQRSIASGRAFMEAAQAEQSRGAHTGERRQMSERHAASTSALADESAVEAQQRSSVAPAGGSSREPVRGSSGHRGWHSVLAQSAAALRSHLGLGSSELGPAGAFDRLAAELLDRQMSESVGAKSRPGRVTLRLRVRESTARLWREVEREAQRWLPRGMCFAEFACVAVWSAWHHLLDPKVAYAQIYARDRHRCTCPVCNRRDVTPHHVVFRSRGGNDAPENVVALCTDCHLGLLHQRRIRLEHAEGKLRWAIGRAGGVQIVGRSLVGGVE